MCVSMLQESVYQLSVVPGPFHEVQGGGEKERSYGLCHAEKRLLKDMTGKN